jgi:hypothetical protein
MVFQQELNVLRYAILRRGVFWAIDLLDATVRAPFPFCRAGQYRTDGSTGNGSAQFVLKPKATCRSICHEFAGKTIIYAVKSINIK